LTAGKIARFYRKSGLRFSSFEEGLTPVKMVNDFVILSRANPSKIVNSLVNSDGQKSDFFSPFRSRQKGHSTE